MQLAVFIDFDNIEIGVKTTLNCELDLALVLDSLRERGEVLSKSAYGDWARAGQHSRTLTDHAVHMVQRNVTPRGDKNGADINLVVDALEMAFTRPHISGFAIVGLPPGAFRIELRSGAWLHDARDDVPAGAEDVRLRVRLPDTDPGVSGP